jgi:hypothetical protein
MTHAPNSTRVKYQAVLNIIKEYCIKETTSIPSTMTMRGPNYTAPTKIKTTSDYSYDEQMLYHWYYQS